MCSSIGITFWSTGTWLPYKPLYLLYEYHNIILRTLIHTHTGLQAQSCDVTVQLDGNDEIILQENMITCIECLIGGQVVTSGVFWAINRPTNFVTDMSPVGGRHVENGRLVISDAQLFTGGPGIRTDVFCSGAGLVEEERVFLEGVLNSMCLCVMY